MNKQFVKQVSTQNNERLSDGSGSTGNGRAQTPELTNSSVVHRHHLDITTPNRHGLLLSSPPRRSKRPESKERSPRVNQVRNSAGLYYNKELDYLKVYKFENNASQTFIYFYCKSFFNLAQFYEIRWPCAVSKGHDPCILFIE